MSWNHRVVRRVFPPFKGRECQRPTATYSILEVYYDEQGRPNGWAEDKGHLIHCNDFEDLKGEYDLLKSAFSKDTLYIEKKKALPTESLETEVTYTGLLSLKDRLRGCLLGCAVGDALGVPLERRSADSEDVAPFVQQISEDNFEFFEAPWEWSDAQSWRDSPGQYSDDTQLMRLIYETLLENAGKFVPDKYAEKLVELFEGDNPVGFGKGTRGAIERLKDGELWSEAGSPPPSAGNGAAMRSAVFGVAFDDMEDVITATAECSVPTHKAPEAVAGAVVVAVTARFLRDMDSECMDHVQLLKDVAEVIEPLYEYFSDDLLELADLHDDSATKEELMEWTLSTQPPTSDWPGVSPYVRTTVLWALNAFLLSPRNFRETLKNALEPGGDVDTTAAIAGALSGVYNGSSVIPDRLIDQLHDRGTIWNGAHLKDLSDNLHFTLRYNRG